MTLFEGWTRGELLQLAGTIVGGLAALIGLILTKMVKTIHVIINSRMSQLIEGARAEGGMEERAASDARNRAQEVRGDAKELTEKK